MTGRKLFAYGMRLRGFSIGCQPMNGLVDVGHDPLDDYWNLLYYDRQLPEEDAAHYDLDFLGLRDLP